MSSGNLARENEGAVPLPLRWLVTVSAAEPLLLQGSRLHASAVASPGPKAHRVFINYLHYRHYPSKGQNSCNLSVLAAVWAVLVVPYKCSLLEIQDLALCGLNPPSAALRKQL